MYIERREFVVLEPGEYLVKVESVQQTDGKYGEQLRIMLRVLHAGGELSDAVLMAWASPTLTPKSKLTRWAGALAVTMRRNLALLVATDGDVEAVYQRLATMENP